MLVDRRTECRTRDTQRLPIICDCQRSVGGCSVAQIDLGDFEYPDARNAALDVVRDVGDQSRQQRRAHHAHLAGDRIEERDGRLRFAEIPFGLRVDETEVDDFLIVEVRDLVPQHMNRAPGFVRRLHFVRSDRRMGGDILETVNAGDFLDQVLLDLEIETMRGGGDDEVGSVARAVASERQAQARENLFDLARVDGDAEHTGRARDAQADGLAYRQLRDGVNDRPGQRTFAATNVEDQFRCALDAGDVIVEVDAALEPVRRVAREVVTARASGDRRRIEERGFEKDVGGIELSLGRVAAHDAGQSDRAARISDAKHRKARQIDADRLLVEERERFARTTVAHVDPALELGHIVDVQRTTELEHHVVGDVDQRRDRSLPGSCETIFHPCRCRRLRVNVADDAAGESSAGFRCADGDREGDISGCRNCGNFRRRRRGRRQCADFARDARDRQAVAFVRGQLEREQAIVERQHLADVGADDCISRQRQQTGVVVREPQLARRAQHPFTLDASHRRTFDGEGRAAVFLGGQHRADHRDRRPHAGDDIRCAAHDVEQRTGAHVDLAHREPIGIRMLRDFDHDTHDDAGGGRREALRFLDLEAGHRQRVGKLVAVQRRIDPGAQPVFGELHVVGTDPS